ncbi:Crp/Fnr family transcriptional regulator [Pedobacter psychrodurus]|uniref:Crp/Fnr family transcriptional regulator n=1 Tax=Pedobacter psychrodurus TaxID=2530456 RepID=UPI002931C8C0|nr:Crp/Fnr family transcriptional regulator [Pedobacter psychrodurus]
MKFDFFNEYICHHLSMEEELGSALRSRMSEVEFKKGSQILFPGEVCKHIYFINEGFFRSYRYLEGIEETVGFSGTGQLLTSVKSFVLQTKGEEGIICEKSASLLRISYYDWLALEDLSSDFLMLSNKILRESLLKYDMERALFRKATTVEKYLFLCSEFPGITNLISQKHIASYLGVSAPTMSGILKELLYKPKKTH